jgi:hypothetical protein
MSQAFFLVSSFSCTYPQHVAFILFYSRSRRKRHDDGKDEKEDGLDGSHCVCYGLVLIVANVFVSPTCRIRARHHVRRALVGPSQVGLARVNLLGLPA